MLLRRGQSHSPAGCLLANRAGASCGRQQFAICISLRQDGTGEGRHRSALGSGARQRMPGVLGVIGRAAALQPGPGASRQLGTVCDSYGLRDSSPYPGGIPARLRRVSSMTGWNPDGTRAGIPPLNGLGSHLAGSQPVWDGIPARPLPDLGGVGRRGLPVCIGRGTRQSEVGAAENVWDRPMV